MEGEKSQPPPDYSSNSYGAQPQYPAAAAPAQPGYAPAQPGYAPAQAGYPAQPAPQQMYQPQAGYQPQIVTTGYPNNAYSGYTTTTGIVTQPQTVSCIHRHYANTRQLLLHCICASHHFLF